MYIHVCVYESGIRVGSARKGKYLVNLFEHLSRFDLFENYSISYISDPVTQ